MENQEINILKQIIEQDIEKYDSIVIDRSKIDDITDEIKELSEHGLKAIGLLAGKEYAYFSKRLDEHLRKLESEGEMILTELYKTAIKIKEKGELYNLAKGKDKEKLEQELKILFLKKQDLVIKSSSKKHDLGRNIEKVNTEFAEEKIQLEKIYEKIVNLGGSVKLYSFFVGLLFAFLSFLSENLIIESFEAQNMRWANYLGFLINFGIGIVTYEIAKSRIENHLLVKNISKARNIVVNLYNVQRGRAESLTRLTKSNLK